MRGRKEFSEWKSGDDVQSMKQDVSSVEELMAADSDVIDAEERARVLASFTATTLPESHRETEGG